MSKTITPEQMCVMIVEKCPELFYKYHGKLFTHTKNPLYVYGSPQEVDPLSDLNAMHEVEKVLSDDEKREYSKQFMLINERDDKTRNGTSMFNFMHATDLQRAEAFCRTIKPELFE